MQKKVLLRGNHALVEGSIRSGCKYFFGYPITPQSEVMELFSNRLVGDKGTFLQAESEVSAINMVIGAAVAGGRVMTASSGPGIDLFQEGIGNLHAHQLPVVIADIMRGGPGNGALHPSQQDYDQAIRGGRGDQRNIVLAPWNAQEMYDLPKLAFDLSEKYRNVVIILADNIIGQAYENVTIEDDEIKPDEPEREWALTGAKGRKRNLSIAHFPDPAVYNEFHRSLQEKYNTISNLEQKSEEYFINDETELIVISYGIVARNSFSAITSLKEEGVNKVGLFRPITLFPFPFKRLEEIVNSRNIKILVVEMSAGQMAMDLKAQINKDLISLKPGQATAEVPGAEQIKTWIKELI